MIGNTMVGSNRLSDAKAFYDALLPVIGAQPMMDHYSGGRFYGAGLDKPMFAVVGPFNGEPAKPGNGTMVSFQAQSREQVDQFHAKALELGGTDEGAPGLRGPDPDGFYGAYVRDLDGNKLCVFRYGPA